MTANVATETSSSQNSAPFQERKIVQGTLVWDGGGEIVLTAFHPAIMLHVMNTLD